MVEFGLLFNYTQQWSFPARGWMCVFPQGFMAGCFSVLLTIYNACGFNEGCPASVINNERDTEGYFIFNISIQ